MIYLGHKSLRIRYYPKYSLMRGERVPPCDFSTSSSSHPQLVPASPYSPCLSQTPAKPTRAGSSLGNSPLSHPSRLSSCPLPECFRFSSWSLTTTQPACKTPGETTTQSSGSTNQPVCRTRAQPPSHPHLPSRNLKQCSCSPVSTGPKPALDSLHWVFPARNTPLHLLVRYTVFLGCCYYFGR